MENAFRMDCICVFDTLNDADLNLDQLIQLSSIQINAHVPIQF